MGFHSRPAGYAALLLVVAAFAVAVASVPASAAPPKGLPPAQDLRAPHRSQSRVVTTSWPSARAVHVSGHRRDRLAARPPRQRRSLRGNSTGRSRVAGHVCGVVCGLIDDARLGRAATRLSGAQGRDRENAPCNFSRPEYLSADAPVLALHLRRDGAAREAALIAGCLAPRVLERRVAAGLRRSLHHVRWCATSPSTSSQAISVARASSLPCASRTSAQVRSVAAPSGRPPIRLTCSPRCSARFSRGSTPTTHRGPTRKGICGSRRNL